MRYATRHIHTRRTKFLRDFTTAIRLSAPLKDRENVLEQFSEERLRNEPVHFPKERGFFLLLCAGRHSRRASGLDRRAHVGGDRHRDVFSLCDFLCDSGGLGRGRSNGGSSSSSSSGRRRRGGDDFRHRLWDVLCNFFLDGGSVGSSDIRALSKHARDLRRRGSDCSGRSLGDGLRGLLRGLGRRLRRLDGLAHRAAGSISKAGGERRRIRRHRRGNGLDHLRSGLGSHFRGLSRLLRRSLRGLLRGLDSLLRDLGRALGGLGHGLHRIGRGLDSCARDVFNCGGNFDGLVVHGRSARFCGLGDGLGGGSHGFLGFFDLALGFSALGGRAHHDIVLLGFLRLFSGLSSSLRSGGLLSSLLGRGLFGRCLFSGCFFSGGLLNRRRNKRLGWGKLVEQFLGDVNDAVLDTAFPSYRTEERELACAIILVPSAVHQMLSQSLAITTSTPPNSDNNNTNSNKPARVHARTHKNHHNHIPVSAPGARIQFPSTTYLYLYVFPATSVIATWNWFADSENPSGIGFHDVNSPATATVPGMGSVGA
ncbi:hypothetical protein BZA70DRAFT_169382 [Myxozyma melibiosi]|uniref:Uncharacterized protein n=1 Tax=Myxozyma melibiosi TaxID=54550 RepID=A0ABR1F5E4_9ASCO